MTARGVVAVVAFLAASVLAPNRSSSAADLLGLLKEYRDPFVVRAFRHGPWIGAPYRPLSAGGPESTDVDPHDCFVLAFTGAVDMESVSAATVRIVRDDGSEVPGGGRFFRDVEYEFDAGTGDFLPGRNPRNVLIFDSSEGPWSPDAGNPDGLGSETTYRIVLPGLDEGARPTVRSRDGRGLSRTFRTTIRTVQAHPQEDYYAYGPRLDSLEASDAPGVPLAGRTGVERRARITLRFSDPVHRPFPEGRARIRDVTAHRWMRVRVRQSEDGRTWTLRPGRRRFRSGHTFRLDEGVSFGGRLGESPVGLESVTFEVESGR